MSMTSMTRAERQALRKDCPVCSATAGHWCQVVAGGRRPRRLHKMRMPAATTKIDAAGFRKAMTQR